MSIWSVPATGELDPMAVEVMDEIGIEIANHKPKRFDDLEDASFDLIVTLSPEAHHKAMELTRVRRSTSNIGRPMTRPPSKGRASSGWTPTARFATNCKPA